YDADGWIAEDNFALSNRQATPNKDGSYTFHFNCEGEINNIQVRKDWTMIIRLYIPESVEKILQYVKMVEETVKISPK
ncbi:MAG: lytic murein transglycosylase, partial [Thermodesulfobacteriota bacterium]|nr:lytic murein transglycosylase [Thermodesulfobacteriota bacterium]